MRKKYEVDDTEKDLFRATMRDVKPLPKNTKMTPEQPRPQRPKKVSPPVDPNPFNLYNKEDAQEVDGDELLEFHRGGLQHKVLRKLRRGQYNVEAILDMHGMRVQEAREALNFFLLNCLKKDIRHVLIIHGKGRGINKPILKNKLNQWLRQVEQVLAFCSATQQDGRSGAVYVLLKGRFQFDE
jgi:DNA-nicking Smr family endonuclease